MIFTVLCRLKTQQNKTLYKSRTGGTQGTSVPIILMPFVNKKINCGKTLWRLSKSNYLLLFKKKSDFSINVSIYFREVPVHMQRGYRFCLFSKEGTEIDIHRVCGVSQLTITHIYALSNAILVLTKKMLTPLDN